MSKSMYTLYLDTCGDPAWLPPNGRSKIRYYVVAGLAITPNNDLKANIESRQIFNKYINSSKVVTHKKELCYHHLIRGKGCFEQLENPQRLEMANEIFQLIADLEPVLFATVVDKKRLKERYGVNAHNPKSLGIRALIHRFALYLKLNVNGVGNVIMDSEEYRKDHDLQEMVREFKESGIIIRGWNYQPNHKENLERLLNSIAFVDSSTSTGIQLADFICRTTWQHFEHDKSNRFNEISEFWNKRGNRVFDPSVIPR